jgi:uncharacterized protein YgiM (DUF1202 family)
MRNNYRKPAIRERYAVVSGIDTLNVRKEPNGEIIGTLHEGDTVKITEFGIGDIWANIEFNGQTAVVVSKYLKEGIL